jgi:hypothetical protein
MSVMASRLAGEIAVGGVVKDFMGYVSFFSRKEEREGERLGR